MSTFDNLFKKSEIENTLLDSLTRFKNQTNNIWIRYLETSPGIYIIYCGQTIILHCYITSNHLIRLITHNETITSNPSNLDSLLSKLYQTYRDQE